MLRADVLKSSAFRLALIFSALFLATFLVAGVLAYRIIVADLHERLDSSIAATYDLIARSYTDGDLEDLIGTVATYAASSNEHDKIFFLADASGTVLAGNVQSVAAPVGLSTLQGNSLGVDETDLYRTRSGTVAGNQLVVATSFAETDEFGSLTVASFGWAGAIAAVIAVMSGLLIAGVVRKRIDAIGRTMSLVGQGELAARIPLRGSGDDLDHLSFQINGALDRLSALVEGMRQVSVDIAHDLKTPLNRLSILVEGAVEKAERASSNAEELYQVQAEIVRINATFEALLRIAQLESGSR
ncbi:MAG: two-component sensor histidine kinase, partial [Alphaproteobacteria bacterium]|nr:two-component sensor histidine kinase [Alphaproteobacteria bacterium]